MARIGEKRQRIAVQRVTESVDTHGDAVKTWTTVANRYAFIGPIQGKEYFSASQTQSEITHRVKVRYWPNHGITPKDRILFDNRVLEIVSVVNVHERNRELELMCRERF